MVKRTQRGWNSTIRPSQKPIRRTRKAKAVRERSSGGIVRHLPPEVRWRVWRAFNREAVVYGRHMCEVPNCERHGEQWHHPFGRIGEPWVSSYLVTVLVCFSHHEVIHHPSPTQSQRVIRDQLRVISVTRLRTWLMLNSGLQAPITVNEYVPHRDELRAHFRYLVSVADLYALKPPGFKEDQ